MYFSSLKYYFRELKYMKSENQTIVRSKQAIQIQKPIQCSRRFLAALVREMTSPFLCPNHGWKNRKQRRKSKFSVFPTSGRRSTKDRGWFRVRKPRKTDLLGFEEVYSVAREAKNKLWSSHCEPCWTERKVLKRWKRTRKQISPRVPWLVYELLFTVQLRDSLFQGR